jgi:hypothetical protein
VIFVDGMGMVVMRDIGGRGVVVVTMGVVAFRRRGVRGVIRRGGVIIVTVVVMSRGRGRMVVMHGLLMRGGRVIVVAVIVMGGDRCMIVMPVRGCSVVVVTMPMVVVRLVLVAHDSIPQPLCAVFSGESGIT